VYATSAAEAAGVAQLQADAGKNDLLRIAAGPSAGTAYSGAASTLAVQVNVQFAGRQMDNSKLVWLAADGIQAQMRR